MVENVPGDVQHEKALVGEEVVSFFGQILWAVRFCGLELYHII